MSGDEPPGLSGIDTTKANIARVYDHWLGGKNNFAADRELAAAIVAIDPGIKDRAQVNRAFVTGAARRAAAAGIGQFLDLGAGLPTRPAIHESVRDIDPLARVAYIDSDRMVVLHASALLATSDGVTAGGADLRDPEAVLSGEAVTSVLDLSRPCAVLCGAVFQFMSDGDAAAVVDGYRRRIAPGSWIIVSVVHYTSPDLLAAVQAGYTAHRLYSHSGADMKRILAGLDIVPPGVTEARLWLAGISSPCPAQPGLILAGAGIT